MEDDVEDMLAELVPVRASLLRQLHWDSKYQREVCRYGNLVVAGSGRVAAAAISSGSRALTDMLAERLQQVERDLVWVKELSARAEARCAIRRSRKSPKRSDPLDVGLAEIEALSRRLREQRERSDYITKEFARAVTRRLPTLTKRDLCPRLRNWRVVGRPVALKPAETA